MSLLFPGNIPVAARSMADIEQNADVVDIADYCRRQEAYDADLQGYFDPIPHDKLLKCLRMRVADRSVLTLIRGWLRAPVLETDDAGGKCLRLRVLGKAGGGESARPV